MIDHTMFSLRRLIYIMLDSKAGNVDCWRKYATIAPVAGGFQVQFDGAAGTSFLWSVDDSLVWDLQGTTYAMPEQALLALLRAPIPPWLIRIELLPSKHNGG